VTTSTDPAEQKAELQTDAAELQQDIKEAKTEAAAERAAGNDARADKLEASIAKTQADLDDIKATLKQLVERPFAPAPGDGETPPATPAGDDKGEQKQGQEQEEPPADEQPAKGHWLFGKRWNE
jgi:seryl-tRNA synthetase